MPSRKAGPKLCEASGDAIPQRGGLGDELIIRAIAVSFRFGHLVIGAWDFKEPGGF
jgi:hypothetical protein